MAIILDGKQLAAQIRESLKIRVNALKEKRYIPTLAVVQVGDNQASNIYVKNKDKACKEIGIISYIGKLDEHISQDNLNTFINNIRADGCMLQLPLPDHLDEGLAMCFIRADRDVDGLDALNAGYLMRNDNVGFIPCTPKGIIRILKEYHVPLEGKHAVVLGRSNIVGKPISALLLRENCTVTICHSHTENLSEFTKQADILVSAIGKPKFVTVDMVKPGAAVIDVGINRVDGKVVGDVDFENVEPIAGWITPVPGGIGPMTIAMLLENTVEAAETNQMERNQIYENGRLRVN